MEFPLITKHTNTIHSIFHFGLSLSVFICCCVADDVYVDVAVSVDVATARFYACACTNIDSHISTPIVNTLKMYISNVP